MMNSLDLTKVYQYSRELLKAYTDKLAAEGHVASGDLSSTADFKVEWHGNTLDIDFVLQEYWKLLEYGTQPFAISHKALYPKIKEWASYKGIPDDNKTIGAITHKIVVQGLEGHQILARTLNELMLLIKKISDSIAEALGKLVITEINTQL